jgi:hypothetical protein
MVPKVAITLRRDDVGRAPARRNSANVTTIGLCVCDQNDYAFPSPLSISNLHVHATTIRCDLSIVRENNCRRWIVAITLRRDESQGNRAAIIRPMLSCFSRRVIERPNKFPEISSRRHWIYLLSQLGRRKVLPRNSWGGAVSCGNTSQCRSS